MIDSVDEFIRLRGSSDSRDYRRSVTDEAPEQVWLDIVREHPGERVGVVQNKTVPLSVLHVLAVDADPRVRFMVAMKRKLTPEILDILALDTDESVRMQVARHRNTSAASLQMLLDDEWGEIRDHVRSRLDD